MLRLESIGNKSGQMNKKIRVVDYVAERLSQLGVKHVFTLTGGGAMFLNDSVAKHKKLEAVCNHHEQASSMAAVAYAKYTNSFAVVMPTTGCGSTNCITGLLDAWQDNLPCIFISGQVNKMQTCYNATAKLRQFGVQEANIIDIVSSITKYAVMINDPQSIAYHLDKAIHMASTGRRGPVWIDIPMDIQGALIDPNTIDRFEEKKSVLHADLREFEELLESSERPVILAGNGVRLSGAEKELQQFAEKHNIPVVTTFLGVDLLPSSHSLNIGRIGIKGNRAANFAMQNSDLLLSIGTRLSVPSTGYKYELFAREAKLVVVDIDPEEHKKETVNIDMFIHMDAKQFINETKSEYRCSDSWSSKCLQWKNQWPVFLTEHEDDTDGISLYYFMKTLSEALKSDSVVIGDAGSAYYVPSQALQIEEDQRYITSGAQAEMGFTIPACIGVSFAKNCGEVLGVTGDGSFQTNIQELQAIVHYGLPIKLFILNNDGYLSIRTTQRKYFEDRFIGTDKNSGVSFPDTKKIAAAYGIKYFSMSDNTELQERMSEVMAHKGPVICEVMCKKWDQVLPALSAKKLPDGTMVSKPLEDMYPFLTREEFHVNMIVKAIEE